jgi:subfamily B ATP-binding cassette protein MsbA
VRRASERLQEDLTQLTATVAEQLAGQEVVKVFGATDRERARFRARLAEHHRLVVAQSHEGHLVASASELLVDLGTTLVVGAGGWLALHGELTPGLLTRFLGYLVLMYAPVRRLAELNVTYQASLAALRRVFGLLDRRPLIVDAPCAVVTPPRRGHVRFVGVGFHHEGDDGEAPRRVLEGIDLEARPGERIAIVGPSGAGKTTLVSLLPRLLDPSEGVVWIDGVDTRGYALTALRSAIALVQQDPFLFSATLRENIAYGCPDATHDAVVRAAEAAYAHEFIARLPRGYETRVGERGVTLSGGQRQRVAIARALLRDPRILILDEATSALDTESERMVQEALERLMQGRTCFVVAHRLSTIRRADRVVVLDGGRIVETGRHACLTHRDGVYARLVRAESG